MIQYLEMNEIKFTIDPYYSEGFSETSNYSHYKYKT